MEVGVVVACRLLPAIASEVEQLARINELFRDLSMISRQPNMR